MSSITVVTGHAQTNYPSVSQYGQGLPTTIPVWSTQAVVSVGREYQKGEESIAARRADYPRDSIRQTVEVKAHAWLARLEGTPISGLQQDAYFQVAANADEVALARKYIAARLAAPGLSAADRAYTYETAIETFAHPGDPKAAEHLPIAEEYLKQLILLGPAGPGGLSRLLFAHLALIRAYYEANRPADVVRHGLAAVELTAKVPFKARMAMFDGTMNSTHELIVDAMIRVLGGRQKIAAKNAALERATVPPADSIALDSSFFWFGKSYRETLDRQIQMAEMVGQQRGDIISNYWINTADTGAHTVRVNDGKIRVIEIGSHTCGICLMGLDGLQRIHTAFPTVETIFLSWTIGTWGNRILPPEEEAGLLTDMYKKKRNVTLPIALWRQQRTQGPDGDLMAIGDTSTFFSRYPELGKPQYYVLDGTGTVRRTFSTWSRDIERRIVEVVQHLLRESGQTVPSSSASTPIVSTTSSITSNTRITTDR